MDAGETPERTESERNGALYLDLLKRCLTRSAFPERWREYEARGIVRRGLVTLATAFSRRNLAIVQGARVDPQARAAGRDWPREALTMVGAKRLDHLEACVRTVVREGVEGDLVETGVWRGGCVILMRAVLEVLGDRERVVWAADSFAGLPRPGPERSPADSGEAIDRDGFLAVPLDQVKRNVAMFGLLDERVRFLPGWFRDTLPSAPIKRLSLLRMDGDFYESTLQALDALHPRLSPGGFAIVDDYGSVPACRRAVDEWRAAHGVAEPLETIDADGVFWRRRRP